MDSPERPEWLRLYDEAFDRFHLQALWSCSRIENPTPGQVLSISESLRRQGDMAAWRLADRMAKACRAA